MDRLPPPAGSDAGRGEARGLITYRVRESVQNGASARRSPVCCGVLPAPPAGAEPAGKAGGENADHWTSVPYKASFLLVEGGFQCLLPQRLWRLFN